MKIILVLIIIISAIIIFFKNAIKANKYDWVIKCGSIFCLFTGILEFFFGKVNLSDSIDSMIIIVLSLLLFRIELNALSSQFQTLFYILTYPEEFRKKFGYSIKEWYGKYSPQYRKEKKSLK